MADDAQRAMIRMYDEAAKRLRNILITAEWRTPAAVYRAGRLYSQIERLRLELFAEIQGMSRNMAEEAYKAAQGRYESRMGISVDFEQIDSEAVSTIADTISRYMYAATDSMAKNSLNFVRATQQHVLSNQSIYEIVGQGLIEGTTRRTITDRIYSGLVDQIGAGKFITVNGRNFDPKYYAEIVARSSMVQASAIGMVNSVRKSGGDLVRVTIHQHPQWDPCSEFQGKIYSISGKSTDFPPLRQTPPFHPNCRHSLAPVSVENLQANGTYEELSSFSKSDKVLTQRGADLESPETVKERKATPPSTRSARARRARQARGIERLRDAVEPKAAAKPAPVQALDKTAQYQKYLQSGNDFTNLYNDFASGEIDESFFDTTIRGAIESNSIDAYGPNESFLEQLVDKERTKKIIINGKDILFPSGDNEALDQVIDMLKFLKIAGVPNDFGRYTKSIHITNKKSNGRRLGGACVLRRNILSESNIILFRKDFKDLNRAFMHELAHSERVNNEISFGLVLQGDRVRAPKGFQKSAKADGNFITDYAETKSSEDWAESVSFYYFNPKRLREECPNRYKFIEKYVKNMEGIALK